MQMSPVFTTWYYKINKQKYRGLFLLSHALLLLHLVGSVNMETMSYPCVCSTWALQQHLYGLLTALINVC